MIYFRELNVCNIVFVITLLHVVTCHIGSCDSGTDSMLISVFIANVVIFNKTLKKQSQCYFSINILSRPVISLHQSSMVDIA